MVTEHNESTPPSEVQEISKKIIKAIEDDLKKLNPACLSALWSILLYSYTDGGVPFSKFVSDYNKVMISLRERGLLNSSIWKVDE